MNIFPNILSRFCLIMALQLSFICVYSLEIKIETDSTFIGHEKYKAEIIIAFQNDYNRKDSVFRLRYPGRKLSDPDANNYLNQRPMDMDGFLINRHLKEIENIIIKFLPGHTVSAVSMMTDGDEITYTVCFREESYGPKYGSVFWKVKKEEKVKFQIKIDL